MVGCLVGCDDGRFDGRPVGCLVGCRDGCDVGPTATCSSIECTTDCECTIDDDDDDGKLSVIFMDSLCPFSRRLFVLLLLRSMVPNNGTVVVGGGTVIIIGGHQYNFHKWNISENHKTTTWNHFPIVFVNSHSVDAGIDIVVLLSEFNDVVRRLTIGVIGGWIV